MNKGLNEIPKYELILSEFFNQLALKANHRELIRAFIFLSGGKQEFEASRVEIARCLFKNESAKFETLKERVRSWINSLLKWQEANNIELIRIVKKGHKFQTEDGRIDYADTRYRFISIKRLLNILNSDSEKYEQDLRKLIKSLKSRAQPGVKAEKYHPRHQIGKDKRTIFTKLERIFEQTCGLEENPVEACFAVLNEAAEIIRSLEENRIERIKRQELISEFDNRINAIIASYGNSEPQAIAQFPDSNVSSGIKSSDSHRTDIYHVINTGISLNRFIETNQLE